MIFITNSNSPDQTPWRKRLFLWSSHTAIRCEQKVTKSLSKRRNAAQYELCLSENVFTAALSRNSVSSRLDGTEHTALPSSPLPDKNYTEVRWVLTTWHWSQQRQLLGIITSAHWHVFRIRNWRFTTFFNFLVNFWVDLTLICIQFYS